MEKRCPVPFARNWPCGCFAWEKGVRYHLPGTGPAGALRGKKVSGTICQELALRMLCTNGTGHLFPTFSASLGNRAWAQELIQKPWHVSL